MPIEINHSETRGPNVDNFLSPQPTPSCFIPICLYSFMENKPFLWEYIPWVISNCEKPRIIIGDYMERHNLMVFEDLTEDKSEVKTGRRGQKIVNNIKAVLKDYNAIGNVRVESSRHVIETSEGQKILSAIRDFASKNQCFNEDMEQQIALMLDSTTRLSHKSFENITDVKKNRLREYIIEEIAVFLALYQKGFMTEIYPGRDMKILQKIASARYKGFPYNFSDRTQISVAVLLDSGKSYAQLDDNDS